MAARVMPAPAAALGMMAAFAATLTFLATASVEYIVTVVAMPAGNMKAARNAAISENRRNIPSPCLAVFSN